MKLAIVAIVGDPDAAAARGVHDKVLEQVHALKRNGHQATGIIGVTRALRDSQASASVITDLNFLVIPRRFGRYFDFNEFFDAAMRVIAEGDFDALYIRYPLATLAYLRFLGRVRQVAPAMLRVVERQTLEVSELGRHKSIRGKIKAVREWLLRAVVQRRTDVCVCVTNEIADYVRSYAPAARCIVSGNGIPRRLAEVPLLKKPPDARVFRLVFVGNISFWSGLPTIIRGLNAMSFQFEGRDIILNIVGDGVARSQLQSQYKFASANVRFLGFRSGEELTHLVTNADFAVGALGNNQRGLTEGSNLKLRLYCALGVPFVFGEYDADFSIHDTAKQFCLQVNAESLGELELIATILRFALSVTADPKVRSTMKQYTREHLTWDIKMKAIVSQLRAVSGDEPV